jgi:hypothetical protein
LPRSICGGSRNETSRYRFCALSWRIIFGWSDQEIAAIDWWWEQAGTETGGPRGRPWINEGHKSVS